MGAKAVILFGKMPVGREAKKEPARLGEAVGLWEGRKKGKRQGGAGKEKLGEEEEEEGERSERSEKEKKHGEGVMGEVKREEGGGEKTGQGSLAPEQSRDG